MGGLLPLFHTGIIRRIGPEPGHNKGKNHYGHKVKMEKWTVSLYWTNSNNIDDIAENTCFMNYLGLL